MGYVPSSFAPCAGLLHRQMPPNSLGPSLTCSGIWKQQGLRQPNWNQSSSCCNLSKTQRADDCERGRDIERGTGRERLRSTSSASLSSVEILYLWAYRGYNLDLSGFQIYASGCHVSGRGNPASLVRDLGWACELVRRRHLQSVDSGWPELSADVGYGETD